MRSETQLRDLLKSTIVAGLWTNGQVVSFVEGDRLFDVINEMIDLRIVAAVQQLGLTPLPERGNG